MPCTTFHAIARSCATFALPLLAACSGDVLEDPTGTTNSTSSTGTTSTTTTTTTATTPASGALRWSRTYGGTFDDSAQSLALTAGGHARFVAHGLLDGSTDPAEMRALVMEVDGDGDVALQLRLGSSSLYPVRASYTAVGAQHQYIVVGGFDHATSLAGCAINGPTGFGGQVIAALDDQGTCLWATTFAASAAFSSFDVSPAGEILLAGVGAPGGSLGSGVTLPVPEQGGARFHARFSPTGTPLSALPVEGFELPIARLDQGGDVIVSAQASLARVDPQGATMWTQPVPESQRIAALLVTGATGIAAVREETQVSIRGFSTSNGVETWNVPITGDIADFGALALGVSEGGVVLAARLAGGKTISVGATTLPATGKDNLVWVLLDATGAVVRSKVVPVDGSVYPSSAATDAAGDVWVLGTFTGSVDFGDGLHASVTPPPPTGSPLDVTGYDAFLVRYH